MRALCAGSCFPPASPPSPGPYGTLIPATDRHKCTCVLRVTGAGRLEPTPAPPHPAAGLPRACPAPSPPPGSPAAASRCGSFRPAGHFYFPWRHPSPSPAHTNTPRRPQAPHPAPPAAPPARDSANNSKCQQIPRRVSDSAEIRVRGGPRAPRRRGGSPPRPQRDTSGCDESPPQSGDRRGRQRVPPRPHSMNSVVGGPASISQSRTRPTPGAKPMGQDAAYREPAPETPRASELASRNAFK